MTRPRKLLPGDKAFVAAYVGTARGSAVAAAAMAGLYLTEAKALAFAERPYIRAEIERLSMVATVVDGKLMDVNPGDPRRVHKGIKPPPRPNILEQLRAKKRPPLKPLPDAVVMLDSGMIAGTLEETTQRLSQVVKRGAPVGTSKALREKLEEDFDRMEPGRVRMEPGETDAQAIEDAEKLGVVNGRITAVARPNGTITPAVNVATRYELKQWLTGVMKDDSQDIGVRLQAVAMLGKSLGLFTDRVVMDEYKRETYVRDKTLEEMRHEVELERKRLEGMRRLASGSVTATSSAPIAPLEVGLQNRHENDKEQQGESGLHDVMDEHADGDGQSVL